ncbi:MAG: GNAT family N-acetyltransferase, partial [Bacteroidales bacterium]|nr:GNAT family N-acetyltransferase [Bacteroidales bacterium]
MSEEWIVVLDALGRKYFIVELRTLLFPSHFSIYLFKITIHFTMEVKITLATKSHHIYAESICKIIENAAKIKGTGIAIRQTDYIIQKMEDGKAIIALDGDKAVGFCYIESWEGQKYVANSGLIVHPDYRKTGLAKSIKLATFELSKKKFPKAKLFGITTSLAVMKINSDLGYKPVTFSELTKDQTFWEGCKTCPNYDILERTDKTLCLCT